MVALLRTLGVICLLSGFAGIVFVMGEVFSRAQGFRTLGEMAPALAFHFVFCLAGMSCFVQVARRKAARPAPTVVV